MAQAGLLALDGACFEAICRCLDAPDMLRLSRSCRRLHRVVVNAGSAWRRLYEQAWGAAAQQQQQRQQQHEQAPPPDWRSLYRARCEAELKERRLQRRLARYRLQSDAAHLDRQLRALRSRLAAEQATEQRLQRRLGQLQRAASARAASATTWQLSALRLYHNQVVQAAPIAVEAELEAVQQQLRVSQLEARTLQAGLPGPRALSLARSVDRATRRPARVKGGGAARPWLASRALRAHVRGTMAALLLRSRALQSLARLPAGQAAAGALRAPLASRGGGRGFTTTPRVMEQTTEGFAGDGAAQAGPPPVFTAFSVYKTKGALNVRPIKPTWGNTSGGAFKIEREGTVMFEIASAAGERRYNWEAKVSIALRAQEVADLLSAPEADHTFYHDTYKGQPGREGQLVKTLKWSRAPDGKAYFINASVADKGAGTNASAAVSLTPGEFYLLRQLLDSSFMYLLGWDALFTSS
ncbi:WHY1 [Scenedesmus sp. PABB004]|nr:WHY1 [Scenedesmus sp. PABB004]